jgi:hypothetical protein
VVGFGDGSHCRLMFLGDGGQGESQWLKQPKSLFGWSERRGRTRAADACGDQLEKMSSNVSQTTCPLDDMNNTGRAQERGRGLPPAPYASTVLAEFEVISFRRQR